MITTPPPRPHDLKTGLSTLITFFPRWECSMQWSKVLFIDDRAIVNGSLSKIPRSALIPAEEYEKRFDELMDRGYSWINMSAFGILNGALIVVIEIPNRSMGVTRENVSINLSGPSLRTGKPQWDLAESVEIVE